MATGGEGREQEVKKKKSEKTIIIIIKLGFMYFSPRVFKSCGRRSS